MKRLSFRNTLLAFSLMACFGMTTTGCSMMAKMFKKKKSSSQKRKEKRAARAKAKAEAMKTFPAWLANGSCDTAEKEYLKKYHGGGKDALAKAGVKFAKCGNWKFVFERLFVSNRGYAIKQLTALENASLSTSVYKGLEKYVSASSQPFGNRYGFHILDFLRYAADKSSNKSKYCKAFYSLAKKAPKIRRRRTRSKARRYGIGFLPVGGCRQYKPFVKSLLASNWWMDRNLGCWILGKWGSRSDIRRMSILSSTDGYMKRTRRGYANYPVRRTCRSAIGKIRIRH